MDQKITANKKIYALSRFQMEEVSFFADSFEVIESAVLCINFCAEKTAHRNSANR